MIKICDRSDKDIRDRSDKDISDRSDKYIWDRSDKDTRTGLKKGRTDMIKF